jgi:hypothetical protein
MSAPVQLIALKCIRCGTSLPAEPEEVAWACEQCGQGMRLHEEDVLVPLEIRYAAGIQPPKKGRPFWVCEGCVTLERQTYSTFGKKTGQAQEFWSQSRRFFIPAFPYPLDDFTRAGVQWLQSPLALKTGEPAPFEPVTISPDDVSAWAEFLVMAVEAERKDKVKSVNFSLVLGEPELWILP